MKNLARALILLTLAATLLSGSLGPNATTLASRTSGEQSAVASDPALAARGAIDPNNGFPAWYRDSAGTVLTICVGDPNCFTPIGFNEPPIPGNAFSQQIGFGGNAYYWRARSTMAVGNGGTADLELALKAAFANGPPVNGEQIVVGRVRLRADKLQKNTTYTLTHPFGVDALPTGNNDFIDFTDDRGCILDNQATIPCDFNLVLAATNRVDPFLTAVSPAPPAGFIGNPAIDQTVAGSPTGNNLFRLQGTDAGGQGNNTAETTLFRLQGKKFNTPPVAVNDTASVPQNSANNVISVLANDSDAEGNPLTVTAVTQGTSGGAVAIGTAGANVTYTPPAGFAGTDTFTYTISDGIATATATVTISANRPPIAVNDTVLVLVDSSNNPINVLANDSDPDGNLILVTAVGAALNGASAVSAGGGSVLYTPNAGFVGTDAFTYTISDGSATAAANVTVTVRHGNRPPVAVNDAVAVTQNSANNIINVLANDSDPDGNPIVVTNVGAALNGVSAKSAGGGSALYTPNAGFAGIDTFTYSISDGSLSASGTVTVTVGAAGANRAPIAAGDTVTVTQANIPNPINVLANDSDPDGNPIAVTAVTHGTNGGTVGIGTGGANVLYTPPTGFAGADTFTYTISDGSNLTTTATVSVTVSAANSAPLASNDAATVTQGSTNNPINVLANDSDPDGNPLRVFSVGTAANGTPSVAAGGAGVLYTPNPGFAGSDSFGYTVSDGALTATATVAVEVRTSANRAPVSAGDTATVTIGSANNRINVLANDSDPDGDSIRVTAAGQSANSAVAIGPGGANLLYTPNPTFAGVDSFTYTISDGTLTATSTVTVTARGAAIFVPLMVQGAPGAW